MNELFTGHCIGFGDHFRIFVSTDVEVHEVSSYLGALLIARLTQVLVQSLNTIIADHYVVIRTLV